MAIQSIIFSIVTLGAFAIAAKQYYTIWRNIRFGRRERIRGNSVQRWRNVLLVALGQQKMFKKLIPAVLHLFIYTAFLLTQIELIEILLDGFFGIHRFFATRLGWFYTFVIGMIEVLSVLALIATIIFLIRRNILRIKRFWKAEMTSWPRLDANLILLGEILLIFGILSMNSADMVLQQLDPEHYPSTGKLPVSSWLGPMLFTGWNVNVLMLIERVGWWLHVLVVYAFLLYLPFSKHLHIFLAFINAWFERLRPRGEMSNMPEIMNEVRSMLGISQESTASSTEANHEFGAKDVTSLSWKNILDAYTCTECGRCTAVCPANITGKKLSPRKIMMDIRDRTEEISVKLKSKSTEYISKENADADASLTIINFDDGHSLFDRITPEELNACTACNACIEACPVLIDPLDPILQMRRYQILMESKGPAEWVPMFNSLESSGAVWQIPEPRSKWTEQVRS